MMGSEEGRAGPNFGSSAVRRHCAIGGKGTGTLTVCLPSSEQQRIKAGVDTYRAHFLFSKQRRPPEAVRSPLCIQDLEGHA